MKSYQADLHIHTALSPCAEREMTPPAIVQEARARGLSLIAISDHNAAGNVRAVQGAAGPLLTVIAGMEITTREDIHVLGLFPEARAAEAAAGAVQESLARLGPAALAKTPQDLMDEAGRVIGRETRMLAASSALSLAGAISLIHGQGGLAVAAHVNRPCFSVLSQLGLFPAEAGFDAVEIFGKSRAPPLPETVAGRGLPVISSSDSHFLADIGSGRTSLLMREPGFAELCKAIKGMEGRRIEHA